MVVTDCPETPFVHEFQPDAKGKTVPGLPVLVLGYYSEATSCGHYVALVEEDGVDADSQDVLKTIEKDLFVLTMRDPPTSECLPLPPGATLALPPLLACMLTPLLCLGVLPDITVELRLMSDLLWGPSYVVGSSTSLIDVGAVLAVKSAKTSTEAFVRPLPGAAARVIRVVYANGEITDFVAKMFTSDDHLYGPATGAEVALKCSDASEVSRLKICHAPIFIVASEISWENAARIRVQGEG